MRDRDDRPDSVIHVLKTDDDPWPPDDVMLAAKKATDSCDGCNLDVALLFCRGSECPNDNTTHISGIWHFAISHDEDCPEFISLQGRAAARKGLN